MAEKSESEGDAEDQVLKAQAPALDSGGTAAKAVVGVSVANA